MNDLPCIHCGWNHIDHITLDKDYFPASEKILTGFKISLKDCSGYEPQNTGTH